MLVLLLSVAFAASPSMSNQRAWTESDKKAFLDYLDTGRGAPVDGQVKDVAASSTSEAPAYPRGYGRKPVFVTLEGIGQLMVTESADASGDSHDTAFGPRLLVGGHLFSWVRYFTGIEYSSLAGQSHVQIPFGIELALIPLGAPHTQYFLLRGGAGAHFFGGDLRGSWNFGLGYEWQISESPFRFHALAESQLTLGAPDRRFYSLGLVAGLAFMF
jgi:hypothetical protein